MNDVKQEQQSSLVDYSRPLEHKPDPLSPAEAMKGWRKTSTDMIALARTLTTENATPADQANLFLTASRSAADKIIADELARLYKVERDHRNLKLEQDVAGDLIVNLRETVVKLELQIRELELAKTPVSTTKQKASRQVQKKQKELLKQVVETLSKPQT
jgi:hypothetical protein